MIPAWFLDSAGTTSAEAEAEKESEVPGKLVEGDSFLFILINHQFIDSPPGGKIPIRRHRPSVWGTARPCRQSLDCVRPPSAVRYRPRRRLPGGPQAKLNTLIEPKYPKYSLQWQAFFIVSRGVDCRKKRTHIHPSMPKSIVMK